MAKKNKKRQTNPIAVAMLKRYGQTTSVHKDRRTKRQNRQTWRKDEASAWDST